MIDQLAEGLARFHGVDPNGPLWAGQRERFRRMADAALATIETAELTSAMLEIDTGGPTGPAMVWRDLCAAARQG